MEVKKAEITGFGHYRNQVFEFLSGNQLFFGENEVGKSTLYQFILAMLFGFPKKSSKKRDYTPRDGAAYGGRLWLIVKPYGQVVIERYRKVNRGKAKVFIDGAEKDGKILEGILAPLNRSVFQEVFTFQQEQLSQIDHLQEEELQASLISLGITGSQQLVEKIQNYQKENQRLFKPRAKKLTLNQQLTKWQELRETIQQQEAEESNVQRAYQQISDFDQKLQALSTEQKELQTEEKDLNQKKSHWSLYEEWHELRAMKKSEVTEQEGKELRQFYHEYQNLTEKIQKKEDELAQLEQGQESDRYFFYLDHEKEIQDLLHLDIPIMRLIDNEQKYLQEKEELEQVFSRLQQKWGWSDQTPPQKLNSSVETTLNNAEQSYEQFNQKKLQIEWLKERKQSVEEEVDQLEQKYPELLDPSNTQKNSFLMTSSFSIGIVAVIAGFFLTMPFNLIAFIVGIICASIVSVKSYRKRNPSTQVKPSWQEKLLQLDSHAEEIAKEEENLKRLQQQIQEEEGKLTSIFKATNTTQNWRDLVQSYRSDQEKFEQAVSNYNSLQKQLTAIQEQREELESRFQFLAEWVPLANKDLQAKKEAVEEFASQMQETKMSHLQQPSTLLAQQLKQHKEERNNLFAEYSALLEKFGLEQPTEIPLWLKQWEKTQKNFERKEELAAILQPIFPKDITYTQLEQYLAEKKARQEEVQEKMNQLLEEKQRLQLQVERLQKNGTLDALYQEENRMLSEIYETALKWSTNQLLIAFLNDLATELSEQQLPQLLKQTSYYFALLTDQHYQKVTLDNGLIHAVSKDEDFAIYELSTGTKDQLIMATRFAYLFMQKERSISPVIIDDGWLHYDSKRKENLAKLLSDFGKNYQVICLSSDQEMMNYYRSFNQSVIKF